MSKLKIFLKSGYIIDLECEDWKFTYSKTSCEYTGYSFKGLKNLNQIGLVPNQIAGYIELKEGNVTNKDEKYPVK